MWLRWVMYISKPSLRTCGTISVCSVQQNDQIPRHQPLPLHGHDLHHLSAEGGLRLQGQHRAAGEQSWWLRLHFKRSGGGTFSLCLVVTEILPLFRPAADQEGKQRGDELGSRGDLWLLQKPQHPLKTARGGCSQHWEGQPVTVEPSVQPVLFTDKPDPLWHAPTPTSTCSWTSAPRRTLRELQKTWNHYIFIKPAISTVRWTHNWLMVYSVVKVYIFDSSWVSDSA